ncbi:MAG: PHP domain-containing protein [Chloroflexi bacterium]|nr:PHP domain-containing protein [Chloroflexota bacterium]
MIVDLHVHTSHGAYDSAISPQQLVEEGERMGLDGVALTEHDTMWDRHQFQHLAQGRRLVLFNGMEVSTDMGHILVFGLPHYVSGIHRAVQLRRIVKEAGGFMVIAHPFRYLIASNERRNGQDGMPSLDELARWPVFSLVDEIEVCNAVCDDQENLLALQVAQKLGMRGVAGSDAHTIIGLGRAVTVFQRPMETEAQLLRELRAGRFYPARRPVLGGDLVKLPTG